MFPRSNVVCSCLIHFFPPLNQTLVSRVRSIRSRAVVHDESSQKKTLHPQTEQSKSVSGNSMIEFWLFFQCIRPYFCILVIIVLFFADKSNEFDKENRPNGTGIVGESVT